MTTTDRATILFASIAAVCLGAACTANPPPRDARPTAEAAPAPAAPEAPPAAPVAPPAAPEAPPAPPAAAPPAPANAPTPADPPALPSLADADSDAPAADPAADSAADSAADPAAPVALVAAPMTPTEQSVQWRDVVTLAADTVPRGFQYFATGVLAGEAPNFFTLDATGAWNPVALPAPPGPVSGHWPDEAWAVEIGQTRDRAALGRLRLHRLRGQSRWVPQAIGVEQWVETDHLGPVRKSWNVGFLAVHDDDLVRIAGNGAPDPALPVVRGSISDLVESKAGDLYVLSYDGGAYHVQLACADEACVQTRSTPLPPGAWEWEHSIPRQKHSVSIALRDVTNRVTHHVLHYETGGWKLEALPAGASLAAIWPTGDGGMWAQTETGLLHRDPAGAWRSVTLPAGFQPSGPVFAAMTGNLSELVIVGARDGGQVVLATAARAQAAG